VAAKKQESLSDSIRRLIEEALSDGITVYSLAKRAGIERAALGRFLSGKRGLNTESLDRLAAVLGWKIVVDRSGGKVKVEETKKRSQLGKRAK
jgi:transcriptional regulator with XRE-family HTH domain